MPTFDLRSTENRRAFGLADETVSAPFHFQTPGQPRRGRGDTHQMIVEYVQRAGQPVTCRDIANHLGRKKTPWLWAQIRALAAARAIVELTTTCPNGRPMMLYAIGS